jgi:DNA polymerase III epsilon subunit-like protein
MIVFDFETSGTEDKHQPIQLAAAAVDSNWDILTTFEMKILFDESVADPKALEINHYDRNVWVNEARQPTVVISHFDNFIGQYKSIQMVSKRTGRPYSVARLAGHNAVTFDMPRLKRMYGERFLPAHPIVLDSLQLALWHFQGQEKQPENYQLKTLLDFLGIPFPDAHDALADVKATVLLIKALKNGKAKQ